MPLYRRTATRRTSCRPLRPSVGAARNSQWTAASWTGTKGKPVLPTPPRRRQELPRFGCCGRTMHERKAAARVGRCRVRVHVQRRTLRRQHIRHCQARECWLANSAHGPRTNTRFALRPRRRARRRNLAGYRSARPLRPTSSTVNWQVTSLIVNNLF
jgi:hypothetical protein